MKRFQIIFLAAALMAPGACSRAADTASGQPPAAATAVSRLTVSSLPEQMRLPGTVRGTRTAVLTARRGGQVTRVNVEAGARVPKGKVLAEVDTGDARAAVAAARAGLTKARTDWQQARDDEKRYKALFKEGAVTRREFEQVSHRYSAARAARDAARQALAAAHQRLGYAVVRAPFAGLVTDRSVDPGDMVPPGAALLTMAGGAPEVRVYAAGAVFARLRLDTPVQVSSGGGHYPASITQLVDAADPVTHAHLVKLTLPAGTPVAPGTYAVAVFSVGTYQALTLPASAVITRAGMTGVLVVDGQGIAHFHEVRTGPPTAGRVTIAAGLSAGEQVVTRPTPRMGNGTRIIVKAGHD